MQIAIRRRLKKIELKKRAVERFFRLREFVIAVTWFIGSYEAINVSGDYALTDCERLTLRERGDECE
jgi:hypothetical protein